MTEEQATAPQVGLRFRHGRLHGAVSPEDMRVAGANAMVVITADGATVAEAPPGDRPDGGGVFDFAMPVRAANARQTLKFRLEGDGGAADLGERAFRRAWRRKVLLSALNQRPDGTKILGWAVGPGADEMEFALFVDGEFIHTAKPDSHRADIYNAQPGTQYLNAMKFDAPAFLFDGGAHELMMMEINTLLIAKNCPLVVTPQMLREGLIQRARQIARDRW